MICSLALLRKLKVLPAYLLPLLCLTICCDNIVMALEETIHPSSSAARFAYVVHALHVPLFVLTLYEISYWLHRARYCSFMFFAFDEDRNHFNCAAYLSLWLMRIVALGLLAINIMINFRLVDLDYKKAGRGGYIYLAENEQSVAIWLALLPSIALTLVSVAIGLSSARYGTTATISTDCVSKWKVLLFCALLHAVGHIFDLSDYPVTSNAGELVLLIGTCYYLYSVTRDLELTVSFANYVNKSNAAFSNGPLTEGNSRISMESTMSEGIRFSLNNLSEDSNDDGSPAAGRNISNGRTGAYRSIDDVSSSENYVPSYQSAGTGKQSTRSSGNGSSNGSNSNTGTGKSTNNGNADSTALVATAEGDVELAIRKPSKEDLTAQTTKADSCNSSNMSVLT